MAILWSDLEITILNSCVKRFVFWNVLWYDRALANDKPFSVYRDLVNNDEAHINWMTVNTDKTHYMIEYYFKNNF